jgi:hypothetical protein
MLSESQINKIHIGISVALILAIGSLSGYTLGYYNAKVKEFPEIKMVGDINPGVTTVQLIEVKDGKLFGKVTGREGRIAYSPEHILTVDKNQTFEVPIKDISLKDYYALENLPEGTLFVASKKGKYYYSVLQKSAFRISPENMLYFKSKEDAENSNFVSH